MTIDSEFEAAAGSVTGRDHTASGRNNQDAWLVHLGPEAAQLVVCDGCGSGTHSEVGAWLGVHLLHTALERQRAAGAFEREPLDEVLRRVARDVLMPLQTLARAMGGDLGALVHDHLLFTIVGALVTPQRTAVFSLGDGLVATNGALVVHTAPDNAPDYLGYALIDTPRRFRIDADLPTSDVSSLLIATDGAGHLLNAEGRTFPGRDEPVPAFETLWTDDRLYRNPLALTRRLALLNREAWRTDSTSGERVRERGLLPDDTTIAVLRRRRR